MDAPRSGVSVFEIRRWWGPTDAADFEREVADTDLAAWVVELDGDAVGFVQAYEEKDPDLRHAGMDLFLGPAVQGRGFGQNIVALTASDGGFFQSTPRHGTRNARE